MRKMLIVAVAVAGLLLGSAGWLRGGDEKDAGFRWERDLAAARARAAREGKPLLVVFRCET